jgi:hypothetical protein
MIRGLSGSLLSHEALDRSIPEVFCGLLGEDTLEGARRRMRAWHLTVRSTLGPTASARSVLDCIALPLMSQLGFRATVMNSTGATPYALLEAGEHDAGVLLAMPWGQDMTTAWRDTVRRGIGHDVRWCFCVNGPSLRLLDARRVYSRRFAAFDLTLAIDDERTFGKLWGLLRAEALVAANGTPLLDRAVELGERFRAAVRESLKGGVQEALTLFARAFASSGGRAAKARVLDDSLIVIYRILFLLFAEARGLVPQWHPVYREGYTIESLRSVLEARNPPRGVWEALQAISRLAHRGCRAGSLRVTAFNGRLFSPVDAPLADSVRLDDESVGRAILALTTRRSKEGRERIAYADLGVEQLGAVYEHVLDFAPDQQPVRRGGRRQSGRRKATGTFYTPRALTEYLVRRTLAPLVDTALPDDILRLRIVDPAMGSGAFLVAACRYLGHAYEQALMREGGLNPSEIGDGDRTAFRRAVAQRCLFGVDINPMAVQLSRLSLWLATLARDRPLTFLDHHLRAGDSLVGASLADIDRQPPTTSSGRHRTPPLPLFPSDAFANGLRAIVAPRLALASEADDTLEQVKRKERTLATLTEEHGPLHRWRTAADLWCAGWFSPGTTGRTFGALLREVLHGDQILPSHVSSPLLQAARTAADIRNFFHWTLEFPEIFYAPDGVPLESSGFDAVLGNPPWEMLRADGCSEGTASLTRFARDSGVYTLQSGGHANLYQLFVERALSLLKPSGRLGFVVPFGLATDHGCAALRRELLGRGILDTFLTVENRDGIFPIHRGLKFTLLTWTRGGATAALPSRVGVRSMETLDRLPDVGVDPAAIHVPALLLRRLSGEQLAIPEIRSRTDLELVSRIVFGIPALGDAEGWGAQFGRELNATDDRPHFGAGKLASDLPVIEGKHLHPFRVDVRAARFTIPANAASRLLPARPFLRRRLAYRDVASPTNRQTLIAAIIPAGVVTTHTLFCLRNPPDLRSLYFLCGMFNSFVANYLIRMRISTHVTASVIERLPVPRVSSRSRAFREMAALARRLERGEARAAARQQALAAQLYGLSDIEFAHVLDGFPLVPRVERDRALSVFRCIVQ